MPGRAYPAARTRQHGQAFMLSVLLLVVGMAALIYSLVTPAKLDTERDRKTAAALAQVKEALIGWSAARNPLIDGINARPGELPCPDFNPLDGYEDGSCVAGAIGRVPWKSLGIPEPKDGAGETLWYTIAGPFRIHNMSSAPITSDTLGNLTVYHNPGGTSGTATTLTTRAVAVIFAPGAPLGTQNRSSSTTMACTAPSGTIARDLCASNYLETAVGPSGNVNNATINGPFIQAQSSSTFNDRLLVITNADLMPVVERRVAREMLSILQSYRTVNGLYPWADDDGDGRSDDGYNRGRLPCNTARPIDWGNGGTPTLPDWLTNGCESNGWGSVIYYTAAQNRLPASPPCTTCIAISLNVNGAFGNDLVLLTPGAASASPRGAWPTAYFEDSQNNDNANDTYVTPASTAYNRDRLFKFP